MNRFPRWEKKFITSDILELNYDFEERLEKFLKVSRYDNRLYTGVHSITPHTKHRPTRIPSPPNPQNLNHYQSATFQSIKTFWKGLGITFELLHD